MHPRRATVKPRLRQARRQPTFMHMSHREFFFAHHFTAPRATGCGCERMRD